MSDLFGGLGYIKRQAIVVCIRVQKSTGIYVCIIKHFIIAYKEKTNTAKKSNAIFEIVFFNI